jgi:hypothetical protein
MSCFANANQSRILESIYKWFDARVRSNPGCVERFICETYRVGEEFEGIPYMLMKISK